MDLIKDTQANQDIEQKKISVPFIQEFGPLIPQPSSIPYLKIPYNTVSTLSHFLPKPLIEAIQSPLIPTKRIVSPISAIFSGNKYIPALEIRASSRIRTYFIYKYSDAFNPVIEIQRLQVQFWPQIPAPPGTIPVLPPPKKSHQHRPRVATYGSFNL